MTFIWPLRSKLTSDHKNNYLIGFLDPKTPQKVVSLVILALLVFFSLLLINKILFSTLRPKRRSFVTVRTIAINFVYYNLTKKHGLQKSLGGGSISPLAHGLYSPQDIHPNYIRSVVQGLVHFIPLLPQRKQQSVILKGHMVPWSQSNTTVNHLSFIVLRVEKYAII